MRRRVQGLVAVLMLLLVAVAVVAVLTGTRAGRANQDISDRLLPALVSVEDLQKAYRDQTTAQREYVLSGQESVLEPYRAAPAAIAASQGELSRLLGGQPEASAILARLELAHSEWLRRASGPALAFTAAGQPEQALAIIAPGALSSQLYVVIRERVDDLRALVHRLVTVATARVSDVQQDVTWTVAVALGVGLMIAGLALFDLRRSVTRPIGRLVADVSSVASGALDRPVRSNGLPEIANISTAVEHMRRQLAEHTRLAVAAERQMAKSQEAERIAGELREEVIGQLFVTGSELTSLANREPRQAEPLMVAVRQLDQVGNRLRQVIFDLNMSVDTGERPVRQQLMDLLDEVERDLGFSPALGIDGPVDSVVEDGVVHAVLATTREALSAISLGANPRHAAIRLSVVDSQLHLMVEHDGRRETATGEDTRWAAIADRAARLGGTCTMRRTSEGRIVTDWAIPSGN